MIKNLDNNIEYNDQHLFVEPINELNDDRDSLWHRSNDLKIFVLR